MQLPISLGNVLLSLFTEPQSNDHRNIILFRVDIKLPQFIYNS